MVDCCQSIQWIENPIVVHVDGWTRRDTTSDQDPSPSEIDRIDDDDCINTIDQAIMVDIVGGIRIGPWGYVPEE